MRGALRIALGPKCQSVGLPILMLRLRRAPSAAPLRLSHTLAPRPLVPPPLRAAPQYPPDPYSTQRKGERSLKPILLQARPPGSNTQYAAPTHKHTNTSNPRPSAI